MDATITTIGDIFKNKVSEQLKKPTIFVDTHGNEYEDYDFEAIEAGGYPNHTYVTSLLNARQNDSLYLITSSLKKITLPDGSRAPLLVVDDCYIKQIGSHVKYCGPLYNWYDPYPFDIRETFRYAYKLQILSGTFQYIYDTLKNQTFPKGSLPEDLFWNCPDLENVRGVFVRNSKLISIPSGLFERNKKLKSVHTCFSHCRNLTNVPGDLFKNNPNIQDAKGIFKFWGSLDMGKLKGIFKNFDRTLELDRAFETEMAIWPSEFKTTEGLEQFKKDYLPDDMDINQVERCLHIAVRYKNGRNNYNYRRRI